MKLSLVKPSTQYKESYLSYLDELKETKEEGVPFILDTKFSDLSSFISKLIGYSKGANLEDGFVPHSTFWLIENEKEIVGVSNIRHELTDKLRIVNGHIGYGIRPSKRGCGYGTKILSKSLSEAKKIGISEVLITCAKDNIASAKIIIKNGGKLEFEGFIEEHNQVFQRYWVQL